MKYRLIWRANPQDRTKKKLYAAPVNDGTISEEDLKKEISTISSLSKGDVGNVFDGITDVTPKYMLMGKSVKLGNIGSLRISFSSEGVDDPAEFNAGMINGKRFIFTPSPELKKILDNLHFELDHTFEITSENDNDNNNDNI
ncbi:MAG: DNA-binding protein [Dysgonamonadaceae bacterium]|jgi:predicted histone-like DNA-binding protein|nr:DNA-binding protein [Dysgonamonadaceae bacterium]